MTLAVLVRPARRRRSSRVDPVTLVAAVIASALPVLAVLGPLLAPHSPTQTDILAASLAPSADHPLGTDSLGRDVLSRLLVGARLTFFGPAVIILLSALAGTTLAVVSVWYGGLLDRTVTRLLNVAFSVPGVLVAILASAVFGSGFWAPVLALALVYTPFIARVVRAAVLTQRNLPYVEACELGGLSGLRICLRHLVPNVLPLVLAQATTGFATALVDFAAVSFLGLGIQPPTPEWGAMVNDGRAELLDGFAQQSLSAGAAIVLVVVAVNVLGSRVSQFSGGSGAR